MDIIQTIIEIKNHLAVLNDDYTQVSIDIAVLQEQMRMIGFLVKAITIGIIGLVLERCFAIFMKIRNGKR